MAFPHKILLRKQVRSPWEAADPPTITHLTPCDQTSCAIATARAVFLRSPQALDIGALEACIKLVLEDLPFLAGRILPVNSLFSWKMGDLAIVNSNAGAELTLADARPASLADLGPDSWPMSDVTISNPRVPFYIPAMDVGRPLLTGVEPLCKIQLTLLTDGCIFGITLSHMLTDGMHWPALMTHIAARYRQIVSGVPADAAELISCAPRPEGLSLSILQRKLSGGAEWKPEPFQIQPSIGNYFTAAGLLWGNAMTTIQLSILHLPRERVSSLKTTVSEGLKAENHPLSSAVTTGDVVQALGALAVHAAEGRALLPVRPRCMVALVQIPGADPAYWGNAVHPMAVSVEEEAAAAAGEDLLGVLRALAVAIRAATLEVRSRPDKALQAMYESEQVAAAPVSRSLAFLAGQRLPFVTATTNYIGSLHADQNLNFGLPDGAKTLGFRSMTYPLARGMAVMRPAMAPYGDGIFLSLSLTGPMLKTLKEHPLLPELVPDAVFLGEKKGEESGEIAAKR